jgi:hypothetical protein
VLGDQQRVEAVGLRQQDPELVAADAAEHVLRARRAAQAVGDVREQGVPRLVAVGVVDVLEGVEVEQDERQRPGVAARAARTPRAVARGSSGG